MFSAILDEMGIDQAPWSALTSLVSKYIIPLNVYHHYFLAIISTWKYMYM